jgi:hypothetical protein
MEYLSIALVLIFVMWLIDKHNVWKQTGKIALIMVAVLLIAGASFYGWTKYRDRRAEKAALIEKEKHEAAVKDCLSRIHGKTDVFDEAACEADPNVQTTEPCWTKPDAKTGVQFDRNSFKTPHGTPVPHDPNELCYPLAHR